MQPWQIPKAALENGADEECWGVIPISWAGEDLFYLIPSQAPLISHGWRGPQG